MISICGGVVTMPLPQYGTTKTANVYMALEIERRYSSRGLHAIAVNPGATHTCLFRHLDAAILQTAVSDEWRSTLKTVGQGAATAVWAAVGKAMGGQGWQVLGGHERSTAGATTAAAGRGPCTAHF